MAAEKELRQNGMLSLPAGWHLKSIGEITSGWQYGLSDALSQDAKTPCLRMNNYRDGRITASDLKYIDMSADDFAKYRVNKGDILFNRTNSQDLVGKVGIFDLEGDFVFASYLVRIVPVLGEVKAEFLNAVLNTDWNQRRIRDLATPGVSQCNVNVPNLKRLAIPVPPMEVQDRIIRVLRAVDEAIDATRAVIDQTRQLKTALLQELLTNGIPGQKARKVPAHKPLSEVISYWQYGLSSSLSDKGQYPCLRMNNYSAGQIIDSELKYIDLPSTEFERYRLNQNDILFNRTNSRDLVGKVGIFQLEGEYVFASYLVRLTANPGKVLPEFLNILLNSELYQQRIRDLATPGVSQCNINVENLKRLEVPIPSMSEQREIIRVMETIDIRVAAEDMALASLTSTKTALSQGLLTAIISVKECH